ncbi:MAG TPA: hypothetical protein VHN11_00985 [Xanthobacteraceae bacterium]|jgi:hypothetical protein|nr:hypothetical protein [Xanthobacteraceae bacterium]
MLRLLILMFVSLLWLKPETAAADQCDPHCDYNHDYGPYKFSYVAPGGVNYPFVPGLIGYPLCAPGGNCAPWLLYTYPGPSRRIIVYPRRRH